MTGVFLLKGKQERGEGVSKNKIVWLVWFLLVNFLFGYVFQSLGFFVSSVDKFRADSGIAAFTAFRQGVSYVR